MRINTFEVDGESAPTDWVRLESTSGVITVRGYAGFADNRPDDRIVMDLIVDQTFRGVHVFHMVTAFGDQNTSVIRQGETSRLPANAEDSQLDMRYVDAKLSRHGGWLFQDELRLLGGEANWNIENGYTNLPPGDQPGWALEQTATATRPWMSVKTTGTTLLSGYLEDISASLGDNDVFEDGSVDVYIPDQIDGVMYAHVVRVIVPTKRLFDELQAISDQQLDSFRTQKVLIAASLRNGRFILEAIQ